MSTNDFYHLIFYKEAKIHKKEKYNVYNKTLRKLDVHMQMKEMRPTFVIPSGPKTSLRMKSETLKLLEENIEDTGVGMNCLNSSPFSQELRPKSTIDKWDNMKILKIL